MDHLLVFDGDSFAHRAYHGVPKSIRRRGNRSGGAIVGFANFLLRLYESERPRAVLVGWDTLDVPTYRHRAFPAYQSGRQFDPELRDQLDVVPHFVAAGGFVCAKSPGYEADDFLAAAHPDAAGFTAVVSGHSHKPLIEKRRGILFINPGSAGPRRFKLPTTVAILTIRSCHCAARIVQLSLSQPIRTRPNITG
jgi:5'-3' exonuclease, N-terminal resolvase-like domain/Calcineurin-like phosphoesterase superfamily domain